MSSRPENPRAIDGTRIATPQRVVMTSLVILIVSYAVFILAIVMAQDLNLRQGPPVGGDFVAFWGASKAAAAGLAADIYRPEFFEAWLIDTAMPRDWFGLTWQYPPTYYFFIAPLAFLPFLPAYALWSGGTFALFLISLRSVLKLPPVGIALAAAVPVCFNAVITGQNGFLTAALFVVAAGMPDRRPLLAGLCAGLLTVKPQLGVLIPFAYLAAGCWRAFFTAGVTALLLAAASLAVFGMESWQAFFEAIAGVGAGVGEAAYPLQKMPTVFAALTKSGVPGEAAAACQVVAALAAICLVTMAWRQLADGPMRAAILCTAAFLCTPYAYYYELTLLVLPGIVLVRAAMRTGFLKREEAGLIALWAVPAFLPGLADYIGAQGWLAMVILMLALLIRRAAPDLFPARHADSGVPA